MLRILSRPAGRAHAVQPMRDPRDSIDSAPLVRKGLISPAFAGAGGTEAPPPQTGAAIPAQALAHHGRARSH
jgi:hypothetical protein